ncbi:MAG: hypothetical protein IPG97_16565 [Microthrixaceae bacterium]|nr:hypothetical protein [Microthrixaceae bacterium]
MGIQDNFWTIGEEAVAWGTKATTLTRGIENQTDDATPNVEFLQSRGMRPATVATPTGRSVAVPRGGQHVLTLDLMAKSLGLVFTRSPRPRPAPPSRSRSMLAALMWAAR